MNVTHEHPIYAERRAMMPSGRYNGAYYYSKEIVDNIIPRVKTGRNWITINQPGYAADHSIVFIHNNLNPSHYEWLKRYNDLVLVVGVPETASKVAHLGKTIYLPLSVDVAFVERFRRPKDKDTCYVGRGQKLKGQSLDADYVCDLPREEILKTLARYEKAYAVGRCAIEAKILGCEILPYDPRFPDPSIWKIIDNAEAAAILQRELDKIDGCEGQRKRIVIDTTHPTFVRKNERLKKGKFNGAYYYSQEIVKNIIPYVKTRRAWDTLTMRAIGTVDGAICFLHQCIEMDKAYDWLKDYKDLVLVVSSPYVYDWAVENGYKAIYLPLSIDIEYVKQFKKKHRTKDTCFCGNIWKFREQEIAETIPDSVDFQPPDISREDLLKFMSDYKYVYAIGRCALEAQALGAKILQCYKKFPVEHWKLLDNKEAAEILQRELDKIDI